MIRINPVKALCVRQQDTGISRGSNDPRKGKDHGVTAKPVAGASSKIRGARQHKIILFFY